MDDNTIPNPMPDPNVPATPRPGGRTGSHRKNSSNLTEKTVIQQKHPKEVFVL